MAKYIVQMIYEATGEVFDTEDEIFDNEEDAQDYANECGTNFTAGSEILKLSDPFGYEDEGYYEPEEIRFVVEEVDD